VQVLYEAKIKQGKESQENAVRLIWFGVVWAGLERDLGLSVEHFDSLNSLKHLQW